MAHKHALIIACSQYKERLQKLPKTKADAAGMRDVLVDPKVCGFPREQVQFMINEPVDQVRVAIERFFSDKRPDDLLLFYFAGHGVTVGRHADQLMLAFYETDPNLKTTGILARTLRDEIEESRSKRQIILLDCCNAAAFAGARSGVGSKVGFDAALKGEGRVVLAASDKFQFALEQSVPSDTSENGIFTRYLIEGLRDFKATAADGRSITARSLYEYVYHQVTLSTQNAQQPVWILPKGQQIGDILLARKPEVALPAELIMLIEHEDYAMRIAGVYKLRDAVLNREEYAASALDMLRKMAECQQHLEVHRAIQTTLKQCTATDQRTAVFIEDDFKEIVSQDLGEADIPNTLEPRLYKDLETFRDRLQTGDEGPSMVAVPAGRYLMGSPQDEPECWEIEHQHEVDITRFAIAIYAVTKGAFRRFVEATGYKTTAEATGEGSYVWNEKKAKWVMDKSTNWRNPGFEQTDDHPVVCVCWHDAVVYAEWLSDQTGETYRLPTEAEWEYAARAGTTTPFHTGQMITTDQANFDGNFTYNGSEIGKYRGATTAVDTFAATWGLYDMHGNVWEWTCSKYVTDYDGSEKECLRKNDAGATRSLRGGSWRDRPGWLRSANRNWGEPTRRSNIVGFRLAKTL